MTNEEILTEIREAMELNKEARVKSNEVLNHTMNALISNNNDEDEYNRGLTDCWDLFTQISKLKSGEREELFGFNSLKNILELLSPQEAMNKVKNVVSDRVKFNSGDKVKHNDDGIVAIILEETDVDLTERTWQVYTENGCVEYWNESEIDKTDEHVDLSELF